MGSLSHGEASALWGFRSVKHDAPKPQKDGAKASYF